jgi:class 3 adenylate cyclase/tetratricopeptide (TPR) repeat protein
VVHPVHSDARQGTVVFADISGFTALSEKLDPEDVTSIMNRCFEMLEGVVLAHGGQVSQYLGDGVVAVFGLDGVPEHARRAIDAALEIRSTVHGFTREARLAVALDVHLGVSTGPLTAGEIGGEVRREVTVTGDPVALAARLEDLAERGQIFVGPETQRLTETEFEYRAREALSAGVAGPSVAVFELLGPRERLRRVKRASERRQATVLFADMGGFGILADRSDPEAVRTILNRCFARLEGVVRAYGGVVDKYIGECLMALFGVPDAIENAPQQAVNAAIEIRNEVTRLARELDARIEVRIGVNSGLVVAGEIGGRVKRDYSVMGDTVNLAARLKDAARPGAILVGSNTHRYAHGAFEFEPIEPLRLKGKAEPVPAWTVGSDSERVHRGRRGEFRSALVGRDPELRRLRGRLEDLAAGIGGVVSVSGDAGIGKSRLMAEALGADVRRRFRVLEGRSIAVGRNLSFHPFVDLLRQWAGIGEDTSESQARARLEAAVAALSTDGDAALFPFVATLMGFDLSGAAAERIRDLQGEALEKLIFKSVRELLSLLAAQRPLLLVFDDLHWADRSSVALLETLLRLANDHPVLFVHVFRPSYEETTGRIAAAVTRELRASHTVITLQPLDQNQATELVTELLHIDDLPRSTQQLILRKAEGNPFYIEEIVRSLIDLGAIEKVGDRYRVTERLEGVEIPSTIQEVILARVDRLDEPTRHILQLGAVIGRSFYFSLIAELLRREGTFDERVAGEIESLKAKELLYERRAVVSAPPLAGDLADEVEYVFQHALVQEAIYESILQKTRREHHGTVATTIEQRFAERLPEFYPMLAYHFSRAEDLERAEHYLFQAGEQAAKAAASNEALDFFREAARLYLSIHGEGGDPRKKALLEKNIGSALMATGQLTESIEHYDGALELLGQPMRHTSGQATRGLVADLGAVLGHLYLRGGTGGRRAPSAQEQETFDIMFRRFKALTTSDPRRLFADNIRLIRRMNALDPEAVEQACLAYCLGSAAFSYSGTSFAISRRFLQRAGELLSPERVPQAVGYAFTRFTLNFLGGEWANEPGLDDDLVEQGLRHGVFWDVNSYLGLECDRQIRMGRFAAAEHCLGRLAELARSYGYEFASTNHDGMRTMLLLERREAREALLAAEHYLRGRQETALRILALGLRAKALVLNGDPKAAQTDLDLAQELIRHSDIVPPWHLSAYTTARLHCLAETARSEPVAGADRARIRRAIREGLRVASCVASVRPETHRLVALLYWSLGRRRRAAQSWDQAIHHGTRLGTVPELAQTFMDTARCWSTSASSPLRERSEAHRVRARELWRQVGLPEAAIG